MLVNSKIYNGIEEYQFITTHEIASKIFNELNNSNKIKLLSFNSQRVDSNIILKTIRDVADILSTDRQKKII